MLLAIKPNNLLLLLLSLFVLTAAQAQNQPNCRTAISSYQFQQGLRNIQSVRMEARRFQVAKSFVQNSCLSTSQVAAICAILHEDFDRLAIAEIAFPRTIDPQNFYDVYDTFTKFSMVFRLHDYVTAKREGKNPPIYNQPPSDIGTDVPEAGNFPSWHYPDANAYTGVKQCDSPSSNAAFNYKYDIMKEAKGDYNKFLEGKRLLEQHCLSVSQIMKLASTIKAVTYRFQFLRHGITYTFDPENYYFAEQALDNAHYKRELRSVYEPYNDELNTNGSGIGINIDHEDCRVNADSFNIFKEQLERENHNQSRLEACKQGLERTGACFSNNQIASLLTLFEYESSKLAIAKIGYQHTYDKANYLAVVGEGFRFDLSRRQLAEYIRAQGG